MHQCRYAQNAENIEDVRTNDVTERDIRLAPEGRNSRCGKFRQAGADSDNRKTNNCLADAEIPRDDDTAINQQFCPDDDACQARNRDENAEDNAIVRLDDFALLRMHVRRLVARSPIRDQREGDIGQQCGDQYEAGKAREQIKPDQRTQYSRHDHHDGRIPH